MFTLDVHPLSGNVHPQTMRISLAIDVRRWKNVSVARSAPKTRRKRGRYDIVFSAPVTKLLVQPISIIKGITLQIPLHDKRMTRYAL